MQAFDQPFPGCRRVIAQTDCGLQARYTEDTGSLASGTIPGARPKTRNGSHGAMTADTTEDRTPDVESSPEGERNIR